MNKDKYILEFFLGDIELAGHERTVSYLYWTSHTKKEIITAFNASIDSFFGGINPFDKVHNTQDDNGTPQGDKLIADLEKLGITWDNAPWGGKLEIEMHDIPSIYLQLAKLKIKDLCWHGVYATDTIYESFGYGLLE